MEKFRITYNRLSVIRKVDIMVDGVDQHSKMIEFIQELKADENVETINIIEIEA